MADERSEFRQWVDEYLEHVDPAYLDKETLADHLVHAAYTWGKRGFLAGYFAPVERLVMTRDLAEDWWNLITKESL